MFALERRDVVSVQTELRMLSWIGVMLIASGVAALVARHLDHVTPPVIASAIGVASFACYGWSAYRLRRGMSLVDDYILLLAALLASADVGYLEHQYHLLGANWGRQFLLLAIVHGVTAYLFRSRLVLSLSIAALAAWFGIERQTIDPFARGSVDVALRAFACATTLLVWRAVNRVATFAAAFEHAAANLAFLGALSLTIEANTRAVGCAIAIALAAAAMVRGRRTGADLFVVYAWLYGTLAIDVVMVTEVLRNSEVVMALWLLVSTVTAIVGIAVSRRRA